MGFEDGEGREYGSKSVSLNIISSFVVILRRAWKRNQSNSFCSFLSLHTGSASITIQSSSTFSLLPKEESDPTASASDKTASMAAWWLLGGCCDVMDDVIDPEERGRGRVTETVGLPLVLLTELGLPEGLAPSAEARDTSSESESESSSPAKKKKQ